MEVNGLKAIRKPSTEVAWIVIALVLFGGILILGVLLRLDHLTSRTMGHIEIYAPNIDLPYELSDPRPRMSLLKTLTGTLWEPHPPAWYFGMWFYTRIFGTELFTLRFPSVVFGVSSIVLIFLLGWLVEGKWAALLAAAMLAFNGHHILWSQISRPYIMSSLVGLAGVLLLVLYWYSPQRQRIVLPVYLAVTGLGLLTAYYYWPFFAVQILWATVIYMKRPGLIAGLLRWQMLLLFLALPLVTIAAFQSKESYLGGNTLAFLFEYLGFGFLFEPDIDALISTPLPKIAYTILPVFAGILFLAGLLFTHKDEYSPTFTSRRQPSNMHLLLAALLSTLLMLSIALVLNSKDPSKLAAMLTSSALPILLFLVWKIVERPATWLEKIGVFLFDRLNLGGAQGLLSLLSVLPVAMIAVVSLLLPFYASRQALVFTPFLLLVIARGVTGMYSKTPLPISLVIIVPMLVGIFGFHYPSIQYNKSRPISPNDYSGMVEQLAPLVAEDDLIFVQRHWVTTPIFYYLSNPKYHFVGQDYAESIIQNPASRVWVISTPGLPKSEEINAAIAGYTLDKSLASLRMRAELFIPSVASSNLPSDKDTEVEGSSPETAIPTEAPDGTSADTGTGTPQANEVSSSINMIFSTYLGSQGSKFLTLRDIAFDSNGNVLLTGSGDIDPNYFPHTTIFGVADNSSTYVINMNADGSAVNWVTIVGGSGLEKGAYGIALDPSGNIYVAGATHSTDFPTTPGAWDRTFNASSTQETDAYLYKLSPEGKTLIYSTYLGGSMNTTARGGLAVDNQGYAYVVGSAHSSDYLDEDGVPNPAKVNDFIGGAGDGFVTKVSQDGSSIIYSRFIGGPNESQFGDSVLGVRVDDQGRAYLHGFVRGSQVYTTNNAFQPGFAGGESDGYYAVLSADGKQILYATYFGGGGDEYAEHRMEIDQNGNAYLSGVTTSSDFPVVNAHQTNSGGSPDGYLVKFDAQGNVVFSTYLGGSGEDDAFGPAIDMSGNVYLTGLTLSSNFETTTDAFDSTFNGNYDYFLQVYDPSGNLNYSSYFGGSGLDYGRYIAITPSNDIFVVGEVASSNFPTTAGALDTTYNGGSDLGVVKLNVSASGAAVQLSLGASNFSTLEHQGALTVPVLRQGVALGVVGVDYSFTAGTAAPGEDYIDTSGSLTFYNGETIKYIQVKIVDNSVIENTEDFTVSLSQPSGGAVLGYLQTAKIKIIDTDASQSLGIYFPVLIIN